MDSATPKVGEQVVQSGPTEDLMAGGLVSVIPNKGGDGNVRERPNLKATAKGQIPEVAVLALLPKPASWKGQYPLDDGKHVWWYARGRSEKMQEDGRFKIVEGWIAASENGTSFLERLDEGLACRDTMGTSHASALVRGLRAYVLPEDGLNVRQEPGLRAQKIRALPVGTVVEVTGQPECKSKMVWWRVKLPDAAKPIGWASQRDTLGQALEWLLVPVTSSI